MYKQKPKSSAKKRFFISGTGKIRRKKAYKSHLLTKKSRKRKSRLLKSATVNPTDLRNVKKMLALN